MEFFKSELFELGLIFGGNMILGAVFKKCNTSVESQVVCGLSSLLLTSVLDKTITQSPNNIVKGILATGTGFFAGKLLYKEWATSGSLITFPDSSQSAQI